MERVSTPKPHRTDTHGGLAPVADRPDEAGGPPRRQVGPGHAIGPGAMVVAATAGEATRHYTVGAAGRRPATTKRGCRCYCERVVDADAPLFVRDLGVDGPSPATRTRRSSACSTTWASPCTIPTARSVGTVCVLDDRARDYTDAERAELKPGCATTSERNPRRGRELQPGLRPAARFLREEDGADGDQPGMPRTNGSHQSHDPGPGTGRRWRVALRHVPTVDRRRVSRNHLRSVLDQKPAIPLRCRASAQRCRWHRRCRRTCTPRSRRSTFDAADRACWHIQSGDSSSVVTWRSMSSSALRSPIPHT